MRKGNRKRREMSRFRSLHIKLCMGIFSHVDSNHGLTSHVLENNVGLKICEAPRAESILFLPRALWEQNQPLLHWGSQRRGSFSQWQIWTKDGQNYEQHQTFQRMLSIPSPETWLFPVASCPCSWSTDLIRGRFREAVDLSASRKECLHSFQSSSKWLQGKAGP